MNLNRRSQYLLTLAGIFLIAYFIYISSTDNSQPETKYSSENQNEHVPPPPASLHGSLGPGTKWADEFLRKAEKIVKLPKVPQECDLKTLRYPVRAQTISAGTGEQYRIFLHPPGHDAFISDAQWNDGVPGGIAFEADYHLEFKSKIEQIRQKTGRKALNLVDIGANIGVHTLFFALQGVRVHSFEPSHSNYRLLQCSAVANGFANVLLHNVALSNSTTDETAEQWCISTPDEWNQGHKVLTKDCNKKNDYDKKDNAEGIRTIPLDVYWERILKKQRVDMMKIDIEGHEPLAFAGAKKMFQNAPPYIMFAEFQPEAGERMGIDPVVYLQTMWQYGYSTQIVGKDYGFKPREITNVATVKALVDYIKKMHKETGIHLVDLLFIHRDLYEQ
ncbi:hypothetical protein HK098_001294 [Nowakowskiella sp. JEL0407]|nr:hypothetical protein HK098_001294 [Nowakowskiella sp. JEL0407]